MPPRFCFFLFANRQRAGSFSTSVAFLLMPLLLSFILAGSGGMVGAAGAVPLRPESRLPLLDSNHESPAQANPAPNCVAPAGTLVPLQVAHAYGFDQLWSQNIHGENMTVYLIEVGPVLQSDLTNYFSCIGFDGATHFKTVSVDTPPVVNSASLRAMAEATLDTEMVAGLARSSNIVDIQTDGNAPGDIWQHLNDELQQVISLTSTAPAGQSVVSVSLGTPETAIPNADRFAIDQSLGALAQAHVSIFAASGDKGAAGTGSGGQASVSFPASDPWVTAVGGTELSVDAQGNRITEVGWPRSGGGSAGSLRGPPSSKLRAWTRRVRCARSRMCQR